MSDDCTLLQSNDLSVEKKGFFYIVCDGQYGYGQLCDVLSYAGKQGVAHGTIDSGEGFIQEE